MLKTRDLPSCQDLLSVTQMLKPKSSKVELREISSHDGNRRMKSFLFSTNKRDSLDFEIKITSHLGFIL